VGHASWLVQTAGHNLLLDPVWSQRVSPFRRARPKRVNDPGIAFADLPPIDVVLVSHAHYDHLDVPTLSRLAAAHRPRVITPLGNDTIIRNHDASIAAEAYDWDQRVKIGDSVAVTPVPARHWSARNLSDRNMSLWGSFVIEGPAGCIYFVADSGYGDGAYFRRARDRHGPFKLAILPIGAYEPRWFMRDMHMNPAEAVQALLDCRAETALASHFGTFSAHRRSDRCAAHCARRCAETGRHFARALPRTKARPGVACGGQRKYCFDNGTNVSMTEIYSGATRTSALPKLRPSNMPMKAAGAFSRPSVMSSR
jgi:L-ascorbate metabolism protein UlaG (beta-lactamase superfamily)